MQKFATVASLVLLGGCATQMAELEVKKSCEGLGKKAFIFDERHSGVPLFIESASVRVVCVGPEDITHLPESFGADAVSGSALGGAGIMSVASGAVAQKAGIKAGDIVWEFAGSPIANAHELASDIERTAAGDRAEVKLHRSGKDVVATAQF